MSELLKEMCKFSGGLSTIINQVKPADERKRVWARYLEINDLIEQLGGKGFDENDPFYCETLDIIKNTEAVINHYLQTPDEYNFIGVIKEGSNVIYRVAKIITQWEMVNMNSGKNA